MLNKVCSHPVSHVLIILLLGTLTYANSFGVPFVFDDGTSILRNPIIQDLRNFLPGGAGYEFIPRRVFGYFTFALNYHVNGTAVAGYHLVNLAIHLGTALLVYALVRQTFRTPHLSGCPLAQQAGTVAVFAALLFVVHPVQTQAVTYIVQRLTSLATLLYLLALVCFVQARLHLERRALPAPVPAPGQAAASRAGSANWKVGLLLGGSFLAAILAMKTKEIAFTLPLAALLYEASFFRGAWRRRVLVLLPLLLTLALIPYSIFMIEGGDTLETGATDLRAHSEIPRWHYLFTQIRVIVTYLRLLVLPIGQNVDYDYPLFTTFFALPVVLSFLLLAALFSLSIYLYRFSRKTADTERTAAYQARLVAFGISWFFLTLAVESSVVPIADLISEHRLYLPSIGLAMAFATLLLMAAHKSAALCNGRIPLLAAAVLIVALATATWQRNQVWTSQLSLWEDAVRKSPQKGRAWYNLGTYQMGLGQLGEATESLANAVSNDPGYAEAWHNLGLAYLMAGRYNKALHPLRQAVQLDPEMADAEVNLAIALIQTRQPGEAVSHLEQLRQRFPTRPDIRYNLGLAYLDSGDLTSALGELSALRGVAPELASALLEQINQAVRRSYTK